MCIFVWRHRFLASLRQKAFSPGLQINIINQEVTLTIAGSLGLDKDCNCVWCAWLDVCD